MSVECTVFEYCVCFSVLDAESEATDLLDNMFYEEENWAVIGLIIHVTIKCSQMICQSMKKKMVAFLKNLVCPKH